MGAPIVAMPPESVLMPVEHPNFSIDGSRRATIAVAVEGDGLDKILVPVRIDQVEIRAIVYHRRFHKGMGHPLKIVTSALVRRIGSC